MKTLLAILALILAAPVAAQNSSAYDSLTLSTNTGRARRSTSGYVTVSASSATPNAYTIRLEGPSGSVKTSSFTATYGVVAATGVFSGTVTAAHVTASSAVLTGTAGPYALTTSTGIRIETGKLSFGSGGFIQFSDGSTQASALIVNTSTVVFWDVTAEPLGTGMGLDMGPCVPGSTATIVLASPAGIDIILNVTVENGIASNGVRGGFLLNGAFTESYSPSRPWFYTANAGTGNSSRHAVTRYKRHPGTLSPGTYSVCLTGRAENNGTFECAQARCELEIRARNP